MFLKQVIIQNKNSIIRDIHFHKGINLIVDETPVGSSQQATGNNVGKTTVLRLVDYCFGADGKNIYQDTEFNKQPNTTIENFLKDNEIIITVVLVDNLDEPKEEVIIRKNFLSRTKKLQEINGENITNDKEFDKALKKEIFNSDVDKPTFRQIISKNIRDEKNKMTNIVKVLNSFASSEVYEALYLFWLGISTDSHSEKERLSLDKKKEESFQKRLKKEGELSLIEQQLILLNDKIDELNKRKNKFNLNENYAADVDKLNDIKAKLNRSATELSRLEIRKDLINESKEDLEQEYTQIDTSQIKSLYEKAKSLISNIQVSFEDTVKFHNDLISEKLEYITKELPEIEQQIRKIKSGIIVLRNEEDALTETLNKSALVEDFEQTILDLNKQFERKGNLEEQKRLWLYSQEKLADIDDNLNKINQGISSKDSQIQNRITEFNKYFSVMSNRLYGETYLLSSQKNEKGYELIVTNLEGNPSTGKKKGQIAAFDFAYIQFADKLDIECLHFIMHDQLETIHDNQLNTIVEVANSINGQYIVPILRDKIPSNIDISEFEILSLSQVDKLFRI
ncbi:Uncharacterized protein YydD, contains DUF2326 domain [Chryseobacterium piscicola]|uniref:Uncharacterized protein YydD, contains DUF2326 domain n=1 Tax=Chryseobacterium piscicola TaxID=551459 RepID=A0A1N7KTT7_9FLAO|nr:DUF2326 domain-containing protein [Chryseobacterium piscicola]PQA95009.1 hypothetical protein B0A70_06725 [Chryseobacterium piscicola]SIS64906.1 Uncharacterized protein YydD, contains DUF2326 domain [Chryseobacterium piscicola]